MSEDEGRLDDHEVGSHTVARLLRLDEVLHGNGNEARRSMLMIAILADIASILGFLLSIGGFWITIVSARGAKHAAERAQAAAENAVARVGTQWLESDLQMAFRLIQQFREACRYSNWPRAVDKGDEANAILVGLLCHSQLCEDDKRQLRARTDDLRQIVHNLDRRNRPPATVLGRIVETPERLNDANKRSLDLIVATIAEIDGRIKNHILEAAHGSE